MQTVSQRGKLTETSARAFACPPDSPVAFYWCTETRGFGLRALPSGTKAFVFQGRVKGTGQEVRMTLDRYGEAGVRVESQRRKAEALRASLREGVNPVQAERDRLAQEEQDRARAAQAEQLAQQRSITLRQIATEYTTHRVTLKGPLRPRTVADIDRHIDGAFAAWADKPIANITPDMVLRRHRELSRGGLHGKRPAPAQAAQAFTVLRSLLRWAMRKHHVNGVPLLDSIATDVLAGELHRPGARADHVPPAKVGAAFAAMQTRRADPAQHRSAHTGADVVMFMLLTGCRPSEALGLTWDRVNLEERWWHMPAAMSKNGRDFWLPLSEPAHALLSDRPRKKGVNWVFPARSGDGHMVDIRGPVEAAGDAATVPGLDPHDLRRTYLAAGVHLGIELWKLELLTCHVNKGSVTISNYIEKSRLQYLLPEQERIGAWMVEQAAIART